MGGISSVIGAIAVLGFLAFLAGVGLVVVSASQGRPVRAGVLLAVLGLVFAIILTIVSQGILVLAPTEVAIVSNTLTGEILEPKRGGTHVILPIVQQVQAVYSTVQDSYTMSATAGEGDIRGDDSVSVQTRDGQFVELDVTVQFRVDINNINTLYMNWRDQYINNFVRPQTRSMVRDVASGFSAEEIYAGRRAELGNEMETVIRERFALEGIILTDLLLRDVIFSVEFTRTIDQVEQERRRIELREAEAAQVETQAQGEANARRIRAEGEAQALALISQQIAANPSLIYYLYITNLADNINLALIPSNSPFLFDLESLTNLGANFAVPPAVTPEPENESDSGG